MDQLTNHPKLILVTKDTNKKTAHQNQTTNPRCEQSIRNLSASLAFLLDISEENYISALIGEGNEPSTEHAIQNWLRPRYQKYADLDKNNRLNLACDDLINELCEIADRF